MVNQGMIILISSLHHRPLNTFMYYVEVYLLIVLIKESIGFP